MLKTSALAIAVAGGVGGAAMAQTVRPPILPDPAGPVLVKHDKGEHGRGRKLGHYKHRDRDEDEDGDRARRSSTRSSRSSTAPAWENPSSSRYYRGYGNSYPTAPYDYAYPAPYNYYRGY